MADQRQSQSQGRDWTYECQTTIQQAQRQVSAWLASPAADQKRADGTGNTDPGRDVRTGGGAR